MKKPPTVATIILMCFGSEDQAIARRRRPSALPRRV
jgi:hypothetical protein